VNGILHAAIVRRPESYHSGLAVEIKEIRRVQAAPQERPVPVGDVDAEYLHQSRRIDFA
jgi:hypothetical protein